MNCGQFRQFYSDFTDGLLDEAEEVAFHVHMAECVDCRRFDAALEQGRFALRLMDSPVLAGDFQSRLNDRILRENDPPAEPALRQWSGMAGAMLVVAMVGVMGWNARAAIRQNETRPFRQGPGGQPQVPVSGAMMSSDSAVRALGRIPLFTLRRDSQPATRASFEITTDWMTR